MFCPKCKKENEENANFCKFCGSSMAGKREESPSFIPTTRIRRFLNLIIDSIGISIFAYIISYLIAILLPSIALMMLGMNQTLLGAIIAIIYYVFFESVWSKTPAKFITKTRVVMEDGEKPNFGIIVIRTLVRCIPFEALTLLSPKRPRGWHDKWSRTIVIDEK